MNSKKDKAYYLPDAELDIMKAIWRADHPLCTSEIVRLLGDRRSWTRATVHVLIGRLCEKGYIDTDRNSHTFYYRAVIGEEEYRRGESKSFLQRIYDGSAKNLVASLIDSDEISEDELAELADIINGRRDIHD